MNPTKRSVARITDIYGCKEVAPENGRTSGVEGIR